VHVFDTQLGTRGGRIELILDVLRKYLEPYLTFLVVLSFGTHAVIQSEIALVGYESVEGTQREDYADLLWDDEVQFYLGCIVVGFTEAWKILFIKTRNETTITGDRPAVQLLAESTTRGDPAALTNVGFSFFRICAYLPKATTPASNDLNATHQNPFGRSDTVEGSLVGAKREQVFCSKVPFEVLEEVEIVFFVVLDVLQFFHSLFHLFSRLDSRPTCAMSLQLFFVSGKFLLRPRKILHTRFT
jgi:hypothetical protein